VVIQSGEGGDLNLFTDFMRVSFGIFFTTMFCMDVHYEFVWKTISCGTVWRRLPDA